MDHESTACQIRVSWSSGDDPGELSMRTLKDIKDLPAMTEVLRQRWTEEILKSFSSPNPDMSIRPWDILLRQDGTIDVLSSEKGSRNSYASRHRIPAHSIIGLDEEEKVKRAERFALGSLIYEVITASQPFEGLSEDEVQDHYSRGTFPDDVFSMAMGPYILACWSLEFDKEMEKRCKLSVQTTRPMLMFSSDYQCPFPFLRPSSSLPSSLPGRRRSRYDCFSRHPSCSRAGRVRSTGSCRWFGRRRLAVVNGSCTGR